MFKWMYKIWHKHFSRKPWVDIVSSGIGPDGTVKLEFDWNDKFIEQLRENGFNKNIEEECIKDWFQALTNERIYELLKEVEAEKEKLMMAGNGFIPPNEHPHLDDPAHVDLQ